VVIAIVLVSVMPGVFEYVRHRRGRKLSIGASTVGSLSDTGRPTDDSQDSY
jgi:hypothetical protein